MSELFEDNIIPIKTLRDFFQITGDTLGLDTQIGKTIQGVAYKSGDIGARVEIRPEWDPTIGQVVYNATGTQVFKILIDGTNTGDIIMGDYAGGAGTLWDNSDSSFNVRGILTATSIYYTSQYVYTGFESLDGWSTGTTGGSQTPLLGGANLQTGATINNYSFIDDEITGSVNEIDFGNKNSYFQTAIAVSSITNQTIYFGSGPLHAGDGTEQGYGFKIVNGTLYAINTETDGGSAIENTTEITGITLTNHNVYRAVFTTGTNVKFYANDVLKATHTGNLPYFTDPILMSFYIKTAENANKILYMRYALISQDI